ncbi:MAG: haloacid dehalogenase-like hydrolase [Oscillospiraceae bacterium]|nr:haloacid dehalogenase-like hydrolase [Oscillospiraceae bacterium]
MNVYDFDKTIYPRDSATDFFWFCVRRCPAALLSLPGAALTALAHLGKPDLHGAVKERVYAFLRRIPDAETMAVRFWDEHFDRIYPWYLARRREDDVIVSASPSFLVGEACRRLGVRCLGTEMDRRTGRLLSPNCRGAEKIRRFREACGDAPVEEFYSDSFADRPMMELAENAWLMKNGAVVRRVKPETAMEVRI